MVADTFTEDYVAVVQGNREVNTALLEERYDIIFFTGSPSLGRKVMAAAAKNLTPVVLELGGKSPCIVDKDAKLSTVARRIAWGKSLNKQEEPDLPMAVSGEFNSLWVHKHCLHRYLPRYSSHVTKERIS